jgi:hypothetical protein
VALPSNLKQQIAKRLADAIQRLDGDMKATAVADSTLKVEKAGATLAVITLKTRSFHGYNIVAELSSSAGEGQPETELFIELNSANGIADNAKLIKLASAAQCSCMKVLESAAPAEANAVDANVLAEIPNSPYLGAVGV